MPSKFGGIPVDESPQGSKFGGIPVDEPSTPGMEKLGGTPPPVPKVALPTGLTVSPAANWYDATPRQRDQAQHSLTGREVAPKPFTQGAADAASAIGKMSAPLLIPAAIANPVATAGSLVGGYGGGKLAGWAADGMGASPGVRNLAETAGTIVGGAAGGFGGMKAAHAIPNFERAGQNFRAVEDAIGNEPVNMAGPAEIALQAKRMEQLGHSGSPVINKALSQTTVPLARNVQGPVALRAVPFRDSRLLASATGNPSKQDLLNTDKPMQAQIKKLARSFDQANSEAAHAYSPEVGQKLDSAMNEYRRAAQIKEAGKTALKVGGGAVLGGAGYRIARHLGWAP